MSEEDRQIFFDQTERMIVLLADIKGYLSAIV